MAKQQLQVDGKLTCHKCGRTEEQWNRYRLLDAQDHAVGCIRVLDSDGCRDNVGDPAVVKPTQVIDERISE